MAYGDYKDSATLQGTITPSTTAPPGEGADVRWIKNGEPAEQAITNRPHKAIADNCDIIKERLDTGYAIGEVSAFTVSGGGTSSITIDPTNGGSSDIDFTGYLYLGTVGDWPSGQEGRDTLFELLDSDYNEVVVSNAKVKVSACSQTIPGGFYNGGIVTLTLTDTIPDGNYRLGYGIRTTLASLPEAGLMKLDVRGLHEASAEQTATLVQYSGGPAWHDGTTNPATDVEAQLDKIVTDLVADAGADRIGAAAKTTGEVTLAAGSSKDQINALATALDQSRLEERRASLHRNINLSSIDDDTFGGTTNLEIIGTAAKPAWISDNVPIWFFLGENSSTGAASFARITSRPEYLAANWTTGTVGTTWDQASDVHWGYNYTSTTGYVVAVGRLSAGGAAVSYSTGSATLTVGTLTGHTASGNSARAVVWDHTNEYWIVGGIDTGPVGWIVRQSGAPTGAWAAPTTFPGGILAINGLGYDGSGTVMATGRTSTDAVILKSTDGGDVWSVSLTYAPRFEFSGVHYNTLTGMWFAMDDSGYVWRSSDGGTSWTQGTNPVGTSVHFAVDESAVLYSVWGYELRYSLDFGDTWNTMRLDPAANWNYASDLRHHKSVAYRNGYMIYGGAQITPVQERYMVGYAGENHDSEYSADPIFFVQ